MTTVLSTKGQLIIPQKIRDALNLRAGDDFTIRVDAGAIVLEKIRPPAPKTKTAKPNKKGIRPS